MARRDITILTSSRLETGLTTPECDEYSFISISSTNIFDNCFGLFSRYEHNQLLQFPLKDSDDHTDDEAHFWMIMA